MIIARAARKFRSVNSDSSAFPSLADSLTPPPSDQGTAAGRATIELAPSAGEVPNYIQLWPYGLGSDNDTFSMRIIGWRRIVPCDSNGMCQWTPHIIAEIACTISTAVGIAGGQVLNTERYADTITIVSEPTITAATTREGASLILNSPANNTRANIILCTEGCEKLELQFDQTLGTPGMNALYTLLDDF